MKLLNRYVDKLTVTVGAGNLFPQKPTIYFYPEAENCPYCGLQLPILKTRIKTVVTLDIGAFFAKEIILECPYDQAVFSSNQLRNLAPHKCTFGFDIIEYVGRALFIRCSNAREIMKELSTKNIFISERQISYLGKKFIIYLALAHRESRAKIQGAMIKRGGYILHLDGTCEGDSPHLLSGLDSISELVLDNIKLPSEKKELLIPFFHQIKKHYGNPIALVHDMGKGIMGAIDEVFPGVADFICHFHFLRDIGKDLLLKDYQNITKYLRRHNVRPVLKQKARYLEQKLSASSQIIDAFKIIMENEEVNTTCLASIPTIATYVLIHWIFEPPRQSRGYGFPFDRPHLEFYLRLKEVHALLRSIMDIHLRNKAKDNKPFIQVWQILQDVMNDEELKQAIEDIEKKAVVFDKLRDALRIALPEGRDGLNDAGDKTDIKTIKEKVKAFREWLISDKGRQKDYLKMIEQIDKYWEKLFADPISIVTSEGIITISPQRTNNILERFFRYEKRKGRKRSGTVSLNRTLKTIIADTFLVKNLENEEYCEMILNGCSSLTERFAQIDEKMVYEQLKLSQNNQERIPPAVKKIVRQIDLPKKISTLFLGKAN